MTRMLRIRNWAKFQHYKDRNPPWIKLHVEILSSEDWVVLDDASKLLAVACMVIAAKNDGCVPDNPDYIKRVAYLQKRPNLTPLIECGFLEIVQAGASESKQEQAEFRPEKETQVRDRAETEQKIPASRPKAARSKNLLNGHQREFEEFWSAYPRRVAKGKAVKAYAKALSKTDAGTILAAARRYAELRKSEDPQYTAYPASWLNGECWTDDFTERIDAPDPKLAEALEAERRHREKFGEIE